QAFHYAEAIPQDAANAGLDSYRAVSKIDLRGVVVSARANPGYAADRELRATRKRLSEERNIAVHAREALEEMVASIKTGLHEVRVGMKDVGSDIGYSIRTTTRLGGGTASSTSDSYAFATGAASVDVASPNHRSSLLGVFPSTRRADSHL